MTVASAPSRATLLGKGSQHVFSWIFAFLCAVTFKIATTSAQCMVVLSPEMVVEAKSIGHRWPATSTLIFSGVVTDIIATALPFGSQITFDVDGIWKGNLAKRAVLFHLPHSESRVFQLKERYVVFAYPVTDRIRARFQETGVDPSAVFDLGSFCDTATYTEAEMRGYFQALGPGRPPQ